MGSFTSQDRERGEITLVNNQLTIEMVKSSPCSHPSLHWTDWLLSVCQLCLDWAWDWEDSSWRTIHCTGRWRSGCRLAARLGTSQSSHPAGTQHFTSLHSTPPDQRFSNSLRSPPGLRFCRKPSDWLGDWLGVRMS